MTRLDGSKWDPSRNEHLSDSLLISMLDGELSKGEAVSTHAHLLFCPTCKIRHDDLGRLSTDIELLVNDCPVQVSSTARQNLLRNLSGEAVPLVEVPHRSAAVMKRFGWGMALAAALAFAILLMPRDKELLTNASQGTSQSHPSILEINGESFIPLPYSNPELPMNSPRIVEMQVPVSSLAAAGVSLEPSSNWSSRADRTVLADVLLGIDGQPLGVHVLSTE